MRVYLDHNATTPLHEDVIAAMERSLREGFGNPSSAHAEGARAKQDLDRAREQVASLLRCAPREVVFTACATEAINTALIGSLASREGAPGHVVSSNVEHPAAEASLAALEARGWRVTRLAVDADGLLTPREVEAALEPDTAMVSLLWANNETGVLLPLEEIVQRVKARGVPLHVDATQRVGKLPVDVAGAGIDLLSLSAHKLNGPKGAGALIVRGEQAFEPLLRGGGQERGRRGGTENLSGVVGLGAACAAAEAEHSALVAERSLTEARLTGELRGVAAEAQRLYDAAHGLRRELEATARKLPEIAEVAYRGGELGVLELVDAHRGHLESVLRSLELDLAAREARVELDRLIGKAGR